MEGFSYYINTYMVIIWWGDEITRKLRIGDITNRMCEFVLYATLLSNLHLIYQALCE